MGGMMDGRDDWWDEGWYSYMYLNIHLMRYQTGYLALHSLNN